MKRVLLFVFLLILVPFLYGANGIEKMTPMLKNMILSDQFSDNDKVDVLIKVKGDFNLKGIAGNHRAVVRTLKQSAYLYQAGLIKFLENSDCDEFEPFYIVNLVHAVIAKKDLLEMLKRGDVEKVYYNDKAKLFPVYKGNPVKSASKYEWNLTITNVDKAREEFGLTGKGVVIGHIDTGADGNHPDLKGKIIQWKDFVNGKDKPYDDQGHGTHTLGTIAGGAASGKAIGAAPDAKLIVAKVFSSTGSANTSDILKAMEWMLDPDGNPDTNDSPRLVSNSWGSSSQTKDVYWDAVQSWIDANIFPCFAAGNSGPSAKTVGTPGGFPHAFAVGATDKYDKIAYFSSRGPITWDGKEYIKPDVSSPGKDITSSWPGGGYNTISGTSMATPLVSGIIALLYQAKPDLTIDEVKNILESTGKDLGTPGKDNTFGSCRVDAYQALLMVLDSGKFEGKVVDAKTGKGIKAVLVDEKNNVKIETDRNGKFRATLKTGHYQFVVSAFAYLNKTVKIQINKDQTVKKDISLDLAPTAKLFGKVADKDGNPLKATLFIEHISPVNCNEKGEYEVKLPLGSYEIKVSCRGYQTQVRTGVSVKEDREENFVLEKLPPVLLVDQDNGDKVEDIFMAALKVNKIGYTYWKADVEDVTADLLSQYPVVIWFSGKNYRTLLTDDERVALKYYLDNGGNLFLTGQDIGYKIKLTEFFSKYLGATYGGDSANSLAVRGVPSTMGQGFTLDISGATPSFKQTYPDYFKKVEGKVIFKYDNGKLAGYVYSTPVYKIVYLGFGFEGIKNKTTRAKLMKKIIASLLPSVKTELEKVAIVYQKNKGTDLISKRVLNRLLKEVENGDLSDVEYLKQLVLENGKAPYSYILKKLSEYANVTKNGELLGIISELK